MIPERKNAAAEESTYIVGSEVVFLFLLRLHTIVLSSMPPWGKNKRVEDAEWKEKNEYTATWTNKAGTEAVE